MHVTWIYWHVKRLPRKWKKGDNFIQLYPVKNMKISHFKHSIWTGLQIYILNLWEDCLHKKTSNNFYRSFQLYFFMKEHLQSVFRLQFTTSIYNLYWVIFTNDWLNVCPLTFSTLGKIFSIWHIKIFGLFFPENRILYFKQIISILHEISKPVF